MLNKLQLRRKLRVEGLEIRAMLAGDVKVAVDLAGNLSIKGDLADNAISIAEIAPGEFEISNADLVTPTTFNGGLAGPVSALGVTGNVSIDLKQGNDRVTVLGPASFPANLDVKTGFGDDIVELGTALTPTTVGGNLSVKAGQGIDLVLLIDVAVLGNAEIDTSDGNDNVNLFGLTSVLGDLEIRLGHGDDFLAIGDAVNPVSIGGHLQINASVGNDSVFINQVTGTTAEIDTSDGIDNVFITLSTFSDLEVRLGHGDDLLSILDSTVTGTADLNGSAGIDTFANAGNAFGTLTTKKFEL